MGEVQIQFKAQHAEVTGAFKMQGTGITINTKLYNTMTIFSWVNFYNDKNYINIFFPEYKMWFVWWFCAIGPIRKHKQHLRTWLTINNLNAFLFGINMFKFNKKNTGTNMFEVNNKDTRTKSIRYLYFQLWAYFTPCFSSFKVDFEQANAAWAYYRMAACNSKISPPL